LPNYYKLTVANSSARSDGTTGALNQQWLRTLKSPRHEEVPHQLFVNSALGGMSGEFYAPGVVPTEMKIVN